MGGIALQILRELAMADGIDVLRDGGHAGAKVSGEFYATQAQADLLEALLDEVEA